MKTETVEACSAILSGGADVHRCAAARVLGQIGTAQSVEALTKSLLDEDPDVRTDAAEALGIIGDPSSGDALMENLVNDPDSDVKKTALAALIGMKHEPVIPLLRKLTVSRSEDFQWDEDEFYSEGWDSWLDLQLLAIRGISALGVEDAARDIFTALADEMGQDVSQSGIASLATLGESGAVAMELLLDEGDARMRRRVAEGVAAANNSHTDRLVERLLTDVSPRVRQITLLSLDTGDTRLEPMFEDADSKVRATVVNHAGHKFPEKLHDLVVDLDAKIRTEVFKVIASYPELFEGEELAKSVQKAIAGEPDAAKQAALAWIALSGPEGIKGLNHTVGNKTIPLGFRIGVIEAMRKAGNQSVPFLLAAAGDDERHLRLATLTALVEFADDDPVWPNAAGEGLIAALNGELVLPPEEIDEEVEVAEASFDPGAAEEEQEIDASMPLIPEAAPASTLDSIMSGGSTADEEPAEQEKTVLSEQDERFLDISKQRRMSKRKMSLESTVAPHLDVRRFAARLLGGVVNADVTAELINALDTDDSEMRDSLLFSLVEHGEKTGTLPEAAFEPLVNVLDTQMVDTRVIAVRALGWLAGDTSDELLHKLLSDPEDFVRVEAVRALERRGVADDAVVALLKDKYLGVGIAAAASIARHRGDDAVVPLVDYAFQNDGVYRRDIGKLLGTYAPEAGVKRLLEVLDDDEYRRNWLVPLDALAEVFQLPAKVEGSRAA
jgi:HEAT repeat protein